MLLSYTSGLPNWRRFNDDGKLDLKFDPGARYSYSGEGIFLLQQAVERITGASTTDLMAKHVFRPFQMTRTSMVWRPELELDHAIGHDTDGKPIPASRRETPDAAGSMRTTLRDWAALLAGLLRGEVLAPASREEMHELAGRRFAIGSATLAAWAVDRGFRERARRET